MQFEKHLEPKLPQSLYMKRAEQAKDLGSRIDTRKFSQQKRREADLVRRIKGPHSTASDTVRELELSRLAESRQLREKEMEEQKRKEMIQFFMDYVEAQKKQRTEEAWETERDITTSDEAPGIPDSQTPDASHIEQMKSTQAQGTSESISLDDKCWQPVNSRTGFPDAEALVEMQKLLDANFGLAQDLKTTPAFVWSYFEMLRSTRVQMDPSFGPLRNMDPITLLKSLAST
ncbi:unnamed protein product [Echinostoma caproni]|uniref:R3H-assoc domain-containing protein n=1 Tax=Echinostoma caproni TaxID=27848 RepID=A0A183AA33_9TREM|nr:unnamed protein product [Echinostoma caproni]